MTPTRTSLLPTAAEQTDRVTWERSDLQSWGGKMCLCFWWLKCGSCRRQAGVFLQGVDSPITCRRMNRVGLKRDPSDGRAPIRASHR